MEAAPGTADPMVGASRPGHQSVTSFYSNLVTRPTGRAVRMGVESQISELGAERQPCLSILDFSQVRIIDYSCADEIVAKLLLRYATDPRPGEVFFLIRGLQDHQLDAVEAVLERHDLLAVFQDETRGFLLLGPADPFQRSCWQGLVGRSLVSYAELAAEMQLSEGVIRSTLRSLIAKRVALLFPDGRISGIPALLRSS
jgi:hypothetical protein